MTIKLLAIEHKVCKSKVELNKHKVIEFKLLVNQN